LQWDRDNLTSRRPVNFMACFTRSFSGVLGAGLSLVPFVAFAQGASPAAELAAIREQNRILQEQVQQQQKQIDDLRMRLDRLHEAAPAATRSPGAARSGAGSVRIGAESGLAFFSSGDDGVFPNAEFRVDDAKIFLEAPVWKNVYFFGGLEVATREANDEFFHAGELYLDAENVLSAGRTHSLSLRVGRFQLPFGEEYQERGVMANPLISHSLADVWGIDEGVQAYGSLGLLQYNVALQNGGHKTLHDFDADKSLVVRLAIEPTPSLRLSVSGLRTGDLNVAGDALSEVWFANAFFRGLGPAATTRTFAAKIAELDARWKWRSGQLSAAAGWVDFDDDSTSGDYSRRMRYHAVEVRQDLGPGFFGAARYSAIDAPGGYALAGHGNAGKYFYNPFAPLTKELTRLSLGLGYRFGDPLVWKIEYTWETGRLMSGVKRDDEDMLSSILGLKF
jgi:hypothetical protein